MGPNPGQVRIVSESLTGYEIEAISRARSNGNNHAFRLTHSLGSADVKECDEDGYGGCPDTGLW